MHLQGTSGLLLPVSAAYLLTVLALLSYLVDATTSGGGLCTSLNRSISTNASSNAVALALIYGYPLTLYVQTFGPTIVEYGANVINNQNTTSTAIDTRLVRPNTNYVYSAVPIDLSQADVVITVPNITDGRSYVFPFYDLYGNNFANVGSVSNSPPGDYLIRLAVDGNHGLTMADPSFPEFKGVIRYPTTFGSIYVRILLYNSADLEEVHKIQSQIVVKTVCRLGPPIGPALTAALFENGTLGEAALDSPASLNPANITQVLNLLAILAPFNPPESIFDIISVNQMLWEAGISNGVWTPPAGLDLTLVNAIILQNLTKTLTSPLNLVYYGNLWAELRPEISGNFHRAYLVRADIAYTGYLQLVTTEAMYPEWFGGNRNEMTLTAHESYIMTFSDIPPSAFWSLTAYEDNYLIPNQLDRYSLGMTSNLTYPNGSPLYGKNTASDGVFQILLQPADVAPPANWTSNWLPAPSGGGTFTVNLRWYGPTSALSDGSYRYPIVTKQAAIV